MPAVIDSTICTKCQECVTVCPVECIKGEANSVPAINADECIDCAACEGACSAKAISVP